MWIRAQTGHLHNADSFDQITIVTPPNGIPTVTAIHSGAALPLAFYNTLLEAQLALEFLSEQLGAADLTKAPPPP